MPVRNKLSNRILPSEIALRAELEKEFTAPKDAGEPDIVIEKPNQGTTHLYVIWSKWDKLEQIVRSRIIVDAFETAKGVDEMDKVTVAMGLTPDEASRLGIE